MPQAAWKRPGSSIGRKGPPKARPMYKRKLRQPWSREDVRQLRTLARDNVPTGVLGLKLQRPQSAIRSKAQRESISLTPSNRSRYSRRRTRCELSEVMRFEESYHALNAHDRRGQARVARRPGDVCKGEGKMAGSTKPRPGSKARRISNQDGARKGGGINTPRHAGPGRSSKRRPLGTKGAQLQNRAQP
jgi:hypothetical protein